MRRLLRKLVSDFRTTGADRAARGAPRRAALQVEGLEDRMVLSSASLVGSTLQVAADPGTPPHFVRGRGFIPPIIQQINFQLDAKQPGMLDVSEGATSLGQFPIGSIKNVDVSLAYLDAVNVDDSNGLPFRPGTTVALSASSGYANSLNLTGSQVIGDGETYVAGSGAQGGSLSLAGSTYQFSGAISSVTDTIQTTDPLLVETLGDGVGVTLNGQGGATQQLTFQGFNDVGAVVTTGTLTFGNKTVVELALLGGSDTALLNATAAAAGEKFFEVDLYSASQFASIDATPSTVDTRIFAGNGDDVTLLANSGRVDIHGSWSTNVTLGDNYLGQGAGGDSTAQINADVFVTGAESLLVDDSANATTHEDVRVTESTVSGTGLFGNSAVVLHYSDLSTGFYDGLHILTGKLSNTYTVAGSQPSATFGAWIKIDGTAPGASSVTVDLNSQSGLNLLLRPDGGSLFISASHGNFNSSTNWQDPYTETITFVGGGLTSTVNYLGFNSVTLFNGVPNR
jgi:hypothetical protein